MMCSLLRSCLIAVVCCLMRSHLLCSKILLCSRCTDYPSIRAILKSLKGHEGCCCTKHGFSNRALICANQVKMAPRCHQMVSSFSFGYAACTNTDEGVMQLPVHRVLSLQRYPLTKLTLKPYTCSKYYISQHPPGF